MLLQGPSPVVVSPGNVQVRVRIVVDLDGGIIMAVYAPVGAQGSKEVAVQMPAALRTALDLGGSAWKKLVSAGADRVPWVASGDSEQKDKPCLSFMFMFG